MNPVESSYQLSTIRQQRHPDCWVCAQANEQGLAVDFREDDTGAVEGRFLCRPEFTGYPGLLHGGVTSALLDGAMTNCLLAKNIPGVTADLQIRYQHPVRIGKVAVVRAWVERSRGRVHLLNAELRQDDEVLVTAVGKFMQRPEEKRAASEGGSR